MKVNTKGADRRAARERPAAAMLPYARHLDNATVLSRDGQLLQFVHVRGLPFETADTDELNYRKNVRDSVLRAIATPRLTLYHHVIRQRIIPDIDGDFDNPFAQALDQAWRKRVGQRRLFVNDLFFTLARKPSIAARSGLAAILEARPKKDDPAARARDKRELDAAREALLAALQPYGARLLTTYTENDVVYSEPVSLLACIYQGEMRPVRALANDMARAVPAQRISFGEDAFELAPNSTYERTFGALISVKDYPPHTAAGQLDGLFRLPHEFVTTQSFSFVDRQTALNRMNLTIRRMRAADDEAISLRRDLTAAKDNVAAGRAAFGEHHQTILLRAASLSQLNEAVADVQAALAEIGIVGVRETAALEPAFWAQFPGNQSFTPRPAMVSSANFASLASCHNHPIGAAHDNHWGPAVSILETTAGSPYYFNFHHGDLGNFLIIGPSGSGKTVVLNFLLAQAQKFGARVVFFDKDRGGEIFIRAINGRYDVLRPGIQTGFNPLQLPDSPGNRRFLVQWIAKLVTAHGETLNADEMTLIAGAVAANYDCAPHLRRLRYLRELFVGAHRPSSGDLAGRLSPWVGDGERAWVFDNEFDHLALDAQAIGFDMTQVLDDPVVRAPAMLYLFHRVEERLDGSPAIIVVDEGWKALDDDVFVARIRDWEKTIRKRNGIVGFATQSASDALESRIASAIIEQSATQIFMPNAKAQARDYIEGFGLTEHEFDLIRTLPDTARCFLIKHGQESVVARLNLSGFDELLMVLSGRERTVRRLDDLRAEVGDDPADWLARLVREGH